MKKHWVGVVGTELQFFQNDPEGNIDNLKAKRSFNLGDDGTITDDNGNNLLQTTAGGAGRGAGGNFSGNPNVGQEDTNINTSKSPQPTPPQA